MEAVVERIARISLVVLLFTTAVWRPAWSDDPALPPEPNQSLTPDDLVSSEAAIAAAASCPAAESIDPQDPSLTSAPAMSMPTAPSDAQLYSSAQRFGPSQNPTADPVVGSGEFVITKTHLHFAGFGVTYDFKLNYRSRVNHQSSIGFGWTHNLARHIEEVQADGSPDCEGSVFYVNDRLERITFRPLSTTSNAKVTVFEPTTDAPFRLEKHTDDPEHYYQLREGDGLTYVFAQPGPNHFAPLARVQDPAGNALVIIWDTTIKNGEGGIVKSVTDTVGRVFYYNYTVQSAQIIPDDVPVTAGQSCGTVDYGAYSVPYYECIAKAESVARMGQLAILRCVSLAKDDCTHPLLSFQTTTPDARSEFDLTSVLDADGNGPSFIYDGGHQGASFIADDQLSSACHTICDSPTSAKTWSCHNKNACGEAETDDRAKRICGGISHALKTQEGGYSCASYITHACTTPGRACYTENWGTDRFNSGIKGFFTPSSMACPYDNGTISHVNGLPEPLRNAACDAWLADRLSACNDPDPAMKAALSAKNGGWYGVYFPTGYAACDNLKRGTDGDITGTRICEQYEADCEAEVHEITQAGADRCPSQCITQCRSSKGAKDGGGARRFAWGRPQDLNHNMLEVHDGDGRLVIKNTYGVDAFNPSFDRVVRHQETDSIADNVVRYDYHDLRGELAMRHGWIDFMNELGLSVEEEVGQVMCMATAGCTPYYSVTADDANVTPLDQFGSVDICPATCTKRGAPLIPPQFGAEGMVPWNLIDPAKDGWLFVGVPIVLQADGKGQYDVTLPGALVGMATGVAEARLKKKHPSGTLGFLTAMALPPRAFAMTMKPLQQLQALRFTRPISYPLAATKGDLLSQQNRTASGAMNYSGASVPSPVNTGSFAPYKLGKLSTPSGPVSIFASSDAHKIILRGSINGLPDQSGRILVVQTPDGALHALSPEAVARARAASHTPTVDAAIAAGLVTDGMVCERWETGPARTITGAASSVQLPEHAVVVHDLHGVTRTNYYDKEWRLVREVNLTAGETTDYNFAHGTLKAVRAPSGQRTCQESDYFGRPTMVATYPAPNHLGDTEPHVKTYKYSANDGIVEAIVDPGLPSQTREVHARDKWDRVLYIDRYADPTHALRTAFDYETAPDLDPHAIVPTTITGADGSITKVSFDNSGGGPSNIERQVAGDTPLVTYAKYDDRGRVIEQGRTNHPGTVKTTAYDDADLITTSSSADPTEPSAWLTTTIHYDQSQQVSHTINPRLDRWLTVDALDHNQLTIEVPRDGKTASKSTCNHFSPDGQLDYTISPEGIVTYNSYDPSGRLVRVERGYPDTLATWIIACLDGQAAPIAPSLVRRAPDTIFTPAWIAGALLVPQVSPTKQTVIEHVPLGIAMSPSALSSKWPKATTPTPWWPTSRPPKDPGMQVVRNLTYAPGGFLVADVDGSGVGRFVQTDGFGRVIDETFEDPSKVPAAQLVHHWYGYDTQGRVVWKAIVGPNAPSYAKPTAIFPGLQSMIEYAYDGLGRVTTTDRWFFAGGKAVGPKLTIRTTVAYDDANRRVTTQVEGHPPTIETHDELERATETTLPNGIVTTVDHTEVSESGDATVTTQPGPDGKPIVIRRDYDDRGLLVAAHQGLDELLHQKYDKFGQLIEKTVAGQGTTTQAYDAFGRLLSTTQEAAPSPPRVMRFAFDRDDRQVEITTVNNGGAQTTKRQFDGLGRIIEIDDPLGRATVSDYVAGTSRVHSVADPQGTHTIYEYDNAGRVAMQKTTPGQAPGLDPKTVARSFTYAPLGRIATATVATLPADAASGAQVRRDYDSLGNLIAEQTTGGAPIGIAHTYDPFGHVIESDILDHNSVPLAHMQGQYDELQRLHKVLIGGRGVATLGYAGLGGPTSIDYGARALTPGQGTGVTATLTYDSRGRRIGMDATTGSGQHVISFHEFLGFDGTPRARTRRIGTNSTVTDTFQIDDANRLIKEALDGTNVSLPTAELKNADVEPLFASSPRHTAYTLDGSANWVQVVKENGSSSTLIANDDAYTNVLGQSVTSNAAGQTTSIGSDVYTFDGLGQLASATHAGITRRFAYDALGRRLVEVTSRAGQPDVTDHLAWDDDALLAIGSSPSDATTYLLRVGGTTATSHLALAEHLGAGALYYVHQGKDDSVLAVSNDAGVVEGYGYSAYGETSFLLPDGAKSAASSIGNRLLFQGQIFDPTLATYAMRAREYRPGIGRFLSTDPSGIAGGGNRYAFVNGMPLTRVDPFGLSSQLAIDDSTLQSVQPSAAVTSWAPYTPIDMPELEPRQSYPTFPRAYTQGEGRSFGDLFEGNTWRYTPPRNPELFVLEDRSKLPWPQLFELALEKVKSTLGWAAVASTITLPLAKLSGAEAYGPTIAGTMADEARFAQREAGGGYLPDVNWRPTVLPEGEYVGRAMPGPGNYFTNLDTALRANDPEAYRELMQIYPSNKFPPRPIMEIGVITQPGGVAAAQGITAANPGAGIGGGFQYFIPNGGAGAFSPVARWPMSYSPYGAGLFDSVKSGYYSGFELALPNQLPLPPK
jgi:RHS repeat-associated protein